MVVARVWYGYSGMEATTTHVLLVEDDDDLREDLALILRNRGFRIETASNGRVALERLRQRQPLPCLILLDLMMPVMNGWEFREAQLADPALAEIPAVVMTAASPRDPGGALQAAAYFQKPVKLDDLLALLGERCAAAR
jgi:CheY-like chemotaxis protein